MTFRWWNVENRFEHLLYSLLRVTRTGTTDRQFNRELEVVRMSGASFTKGAETLEVEGIPINVFAPAKTIADCFKFRGRVGTDTAIEALRSYVRSGVGPVDDLYHYADVCSVQTVMRPYFEAIV